ncbi:histidine phosphatase family protein [Thalassiella azotivora]
MARLVLVRHGESVGNVADAEARRRGAHRLDLDVRDPDVELSGTGRDQAAAVGRYLRDLDEDERPHVVVTSPFQRALGTAETALEVAGLDVPLVVDERVRERDLGAFDGMTGDGIKATFPDEAEHRGKVGKFYYRPPGGESWCDVAHRVRSVLRDLHDEHRDSRLWLFSHQAVIMSFRLAIEGLREAELLEIDREDPVPNCSLTTYARTDHGRLELVRYADTTAVERTEAPTTAEPGADDAADEQADEQADPSEGRRDAS